MNSLIERARSGDAEAFGVLVKGMQDELYAIAWSILRNDADVADALQETVLKCWLKLDTLREPAYFKSWAVRILMNECYALTRDHAKAEPAAAPPEQSQAEAGYALAEWQSLLALLDERSRILVVLHYAHGYKLAEIARILGTNENTVKAQLASARRSYERLVMQGSMERP